MREELRAFITGELMHEPTYPLKDDEPLITGGLMASLDLVQLAVFIEEQFGVRFDNSELTVDNMDTIDQIAANIAAKG